VKLYTHAFLTSARDGGKWLASFRGHFTPGKGPPVPIARQTVRAAELVWTRWWKKSITSPAGNWTPVLQPVVRKNGF